MSVGLEVRNLTKQFGEGEESVTAVDNISFKIEQGELFSLLGESGCGKTTTLRMIAGLEQVTNGSILFSGKDFTHVPPNKRGIGMVFQSYALYPHMTIFENVAYGLRIRRTSKSEVTKKVNETLKIVDLPPETYAHRRPSELSGGQQQRIALARALVYDPYLLLFDEPLSNLDAKLRVYMRDEIRKVQQRLGITAVYVTHDQEEALAISDRIAVMFNGCIEQNNSPLEVYERPATVHVADFIGKANLIPATLIESNGTHGVARMESDETLEGLINTNQDSPGSDITIMIRPERLSISKPNTTSDSGSTSGNQIEATIVGITFLGSRTRYELKTASGVTITCDSIRLIEGLEPGHTVHAKVDTNEVLFLTKTAKDVHGNLEPGKAVELNDKESS